MREKPSLKPSCWIKIPFEGVNGTGTRQFSDSMSVSKFCLKFYSELLVL